MFTPAVPVSGLAGWQFLKATEARQRQVFASAREIRREEEYFRGRIGTVASVDDLLGDRRLLMVSLAAFGLEDEIGKTHFLRRILQDDLGSADALINKLVDKRFRKWAEAFGAVALQTGRAAAAAEKTINAFRARRFEVAVGGVDNDMRLALTFRREIPAVLAEAGGDSAAWFRILGNPPLREVLQTALGLPESIAGLDLDRQRVSFESKAAPLLGEAGVRALADTERVEAVIRRFLLRRQIAAFGPATGSVALTLLGAAASSAANLSKAQLL